MTAPSKINARANSAKTMRLVGDIAAIGFEPIPKLLSVMSVEEFRRRSDAVRVAFGAATAMLELEADPIVHALIADDPNDPTSSVAEFTEALQWLGDVSAIIEAARAHCLVSLSRYATEAEQ